MFSNIKDFAAGDTELNVDKTGGPSDSDLKISTIAILLQMAHADGRMDSAEKVVLLESVKKHFAEDGQEAEQLLKAAENLGSDLAKTAKLVGAINEHFSDEQRQQVLGLLWKIVKADGLVDKYEIKYATEVRTLLNLTMEQGLAARALAEED